MRTLALILFSLFIVWKSPAQQENGNLAIEFTEIDSLKYADLKGNFSNDAVFDTVEMVYLDSICTFITQSDTVRFSCRPDYGDHYYYKGYLPQINSHVIAVCGQGVCVSFLIQKSTSETHELFSPFDSECEVPVFSKDHNKMFAYVSSVFSDETCIMVYKRLNNQVNFDFNTFEHTIIYRNIHEAIWIDDSTIGLMTCDTYGGEFGNEPMNVKYYIGVMEQ